MGTRFDLPIAAALLAAMGIIPPEHTEGLLVAGEVGLNGKIRPVSRPKRKNRKHIQIIHDREETDREALLAAGHLSDDAVRQHLKRYRRESQP